MKLTLSTLPALLILNWSLEGAEVGKSGELQEGMRLKLRYAQEVLEGITKENFPLVSTNAYRLRQLSSTPGWQAKNTPEFRRLTADYDRAADALQKAAAKRNVDAAASAYSRLSTSCVNCHKYLRGADVGSGPHQQPARDTRLAQARFSRSQIP